MSDWKQEARERYEKQEQKAFDKAGKIEDKINKLIGKELSPLELMSLRGLIEELEYQYKAIDKAQDRLWEIQ